MTLWIRSFDKTIFQKVDNLLISNGTNEDKTFNIYSNTANGLYLIQNVLGKYKAKERAIEVLDEIQSKLTSNKIIMQLNGGTKISQEKVDYFNDNYDIKLIPAGAELKSVPNEVVIYQMPEE